MSKTHTLTRRGQESRKRMVEAAGQLFYRQGVNATSVDDILAAANMGKSQFYHYFEAKEELVCAVVDFQIERILGFLQPYTDRLLNMEDLQAWFRAYLEMAELSGCLGCPVGAIAAETAPSQPAIRARIWQAFFRWKDSLRGALGRMQEQGEFVAGFDPDRSAEFIACCVQGSLLLTRAFQDSMFLDHISQELSCYLSTWLSDSARERRSAVPP